jgi:hypothetical protein
MTLHVNRSTVGREAPLTPLAADQEQAERRPAADAAGTPADCGADTAAISAQGQRLASLDEGSAAQLRAVAAAEELARSLAARIAQQPQAAKAAQGQLDPSRVASLLEG